MTHACVGGIAPRSTALMHTEWDHARGGNSPDALHEARRREESAWQQAQRDAGLDPIAPALASWQDILRPLIENCEGIDEGPLTRTFETNTFHRQPRIHARPTLRHPAACLPAPLPATPWILTLPAPMDALRRSETVDGLEPSEALDGLADALNRIAHAGREAGARIIRFHDPGLLYPRTPAAQRTLDGLARASRGIAGSCTLHLTQGDPFHQWDLLESLPVGGLSIEGPGPQVPRGFRLPDGVHLTVAGIDGDQSLLEDPTDVARRARSLADALDTDLWGITNAWDLEHLPHAVALQKLPVLARAAARTMEEVAA